MLLIGLSLVLLRPLATAADGNPGGEFPDFRKVEQERLLRQGTGELRYLRIFVVYTGALYLPADTPADNVLGDTAKRLEVVYRRSIKGEDFGPATHTWIQRNVPSDVYARLKSAINDHTALYQDVKPGDRYALTYVPGRGTELSLNGEPIGVTPGADFARALFAIWFGGDPIDPHFKKALMGKSS